MPQYLLGVDLGSSAIKASIIEAESGRVAGLASSPSTEMAINSPKHDWAEQDPELWWDNTIQAVKTAIERASIDPDAIAGIGISYQMHGLVLVDKNHQVLRPSIIWCDSRAVQLGEEAYNQLGELYCMERLMNSPGNFTASKLKWVKDNEPEVYARIHKVMLPGDYLAMRLTGEISTTVSGLSEGIMWDYQKESLPERLFNYYGLDQNHVAQVVPTFSIQGQLTSEVAKAMGLKAGIPVAYRAGDQPNNAFSLNALHPGEVAATAGTSGVIYGIVNTPTADTQARVNTFVHVNHDKENPRFGVLLCVNGTGIMNSWLRNTLFSMNHPVEYNQLNDLAAQAPVGSDKLYILPFGNGAERMLRSREVGASFHGLNLNRHKAPHVCRATQEGVVFALGYGFDILNELNIKSTVIRAGHANMFLSKVFCETFANVTGARLELYNTDGAQGAARGAGVGMGYYKSPDEAFKNLTRISTYEPDPVHQEKYLSAFAEWKSILNTQLKNK
jgi:xylulokinase